jgi:hypothetical protein
VLLGDGDLNTIYISSEYILREYNSNDKINPGNELGHVLISTSTRAKSMDLET